MTRSTRTRRSLRFVAGVVLALTTACGSSDPPGGADGADAANSGDGGDAAVARLDGGMGEALPTAVAPSDPERVAARRQWGDLVVTNEVLVRGPGDEVESVARALGGRIVGGMPSVDMWQVRFEDAATDSDLVNERIASFEATGELEGFANGVLEPLLYPNDGYSWEGANDDCACGDAWNDRGLRDQVWGQWAIDLPGAWDITTGDPDQGIAVVDAGFMPEHEDFGGRAGLLLGGDTSAEDVAHGTHVAGILGATGGNERGIAGVNWRASLGLATQSAWAGLHPCHDLTTQLAVMQAMNRVLGRSLANPGAIRVVNYSLGTNWYENERVCLGPGDRETRCYPTDGLMMEGCPDERWLEKQKRKWRPVLARLRDAGMLLVGSAGNNSNPGQRMVDAKWSGGPQALAGEFPDNIMVVASVGMSRLRDHGTFFGTWSDEWHGLSWFSSVGPLVDVAAPGAQILSLSPYGANDERPRVAYLSGTSMAAPFVTGAASLLWAIRPELTAAEVKSLLVSAARRSGRQVYRSLGGEDGAEQVETYPFHVLDAAEALRIIDRPAGCTDADGDGYGAANADGAVGLDCPERIADCDDGDPGVNDGAPELCDGKDNDCNGHTDEENVCMGVLADAPVSGVVPGLFDTNGGEFRVSVSPLDPNGELVHEQLEARNFTFRDIEVERLDAPGRVVAAGEAVATEIEVHLPRDGREALRLVLLFDSSGSMAENDGGYLRVRAARDLLRQLDAADEVAVMDFGAGGSTTRLLAPMSADRAAAEAGLEWVTSEGGTPMYAAVLEAVDYLQGGDQGRRVLVLLSDGQANSDDVPLAPRAVEAAIAAEVTVYAVGLGESLDFGHLETLTGGSGGTFAFARDAGVLAGLFDAIGVAAARGRVVVHGEGRFMPALMQSGRHLVRGQLRTSLGNERRDTPFDFTVMIGE